MTMYSIEADTANKRLGNLAITPTSLGTMRRRPGDRGHRQLRPAEEISDDQVRLRKSPTRA